ncbi:hypothetical protein K458DRAFT_97997 [Lentithecium fluviatile CBS 122367]|uniref:Uncharacterized protein n=1 Tax=Lentithecium fluviatile CBS 122367 TaxID=1168545 RepID=A0A6G1JHV9_9PLEO|nr:hypothetical protein K458DRAFT_97997 [Lentithecium fluviatile CBS 122367]
MHKYTKSEGKGGELQPSLKRLCIACMRHFRYWSAAVRSYAFASAGQRETFGWSVVHRAEERLCVLCRTSNSCGGGPGRVGHALSPREVGEISIHDRCGMGCFGSTAEQSVEHSVTSTVIMRGIQQHLSGPHRLLCLPLLCLHWCMLPVSGGWLHVSPPQKASPRSRGRGGLAPTIPG